MNAPCKDCPDRVVGCHSTCERYKEWKAEKDQERDARKVQALGTPVTSRQLIINWRIKQKLARERNERG